MVSAVDTGSPASPGSSASLGRSRLVLGYAVLAAFVAATLGFSITAGQDAEAAPAIGGTYTTSTPACFGSTFVLDQSGEFVDIDGDGDSKAVLRLDDDRLTGDASCAGGTAGAWISRSRWRTRGRASRARSRAEPFASRDPRAGHGRRRRGQEASQRRGDVRPADARDRRRDARRAAVRRRRSRGSASRA